MGARDTRITVLAFFNRISLFYTLAPLLLAKDVAARLDFTQSVSHCLQRDRNSVLLIVRYFEGQGQKDEPIDSALMARLRFVLPRRRAADGPCSPCTSQNFGFV